MPYGETQIDFENGIKAYLAQQYPNREPNHIRHPKNRIKYNLASTQLLPLLETTLYENFSRGSAVHVADIGGGNGTLLSRLHKRQNTNYSLFLTLTSLTWFYPKLVQDRLRKGIIDQAVLMDIESPPEELHGQIDLALGSYSMLWWCTDFEKATKGLRTVLKPNGIAIANFRADNLFTEMYHELEEPEPFIIYQFQNVGFDCISLQEDDIINTTWTATLRSI